MRSGLAVALATLLIAPAAASAADATFSTVKIKDAGSNQEPRIAVGRDDVRYVVALDGDTGGTEHVWRSADGGQTWQKTAGDPPQQSATIDVDVVTMPTGRILSSELDTAGLNFPTGYSDDGGKTWTQSIGSTTLADQDRQWFAVGPVPKGSPAGTQPPVYLLYHNLGSGVAQHNMWVSTSTDGGATFGPPVPIAQPGSDAYLDLQCSDSGGPSNITVNPKTGRIYAFYTTRATPTAGGDAGGCAGPVFGQPIEFNIVNGTRVWVATSKDGSVGSWSNSLAVDDSATGQVVSMQLAYGALDNTGTVYVAYPESPHPYPNLEGSGVKLVWQTPDADGNLTDGKWSKPATLVEPKPDTAIKAGGADLVHLVAGDPGKIAVAYYYGPTTTAAQTPFYAHFLQSFDAKSPTPHVTDYQVSDKPAFTWSVSGMMGLCDTAQQAGPFEGVVAGLGCDRSTDVWGIAMDAQCRVMSVWTGRAPTADAGTPGQEAGTFVTTQTGGPTLCGASTSTPGGSQAVPFQAPPSSTIPGEQGSSTSGGKNPCRDRVAPASKVVGKVGLTRTSLKLRGTAIDRGCGVKGKRARARVRSVAVAVAFVPGSNHCRFVRGDGTLGPTSNCRHPTFVIASGRAAWKLSLRGKFPKGHYYVWSRATDVANNVQRKPSSRHLVHVRLR